LIHNLRKVWSPNTAESLKVKKYNKIKDFIHVSGPLGVSHLMIFKQTQLGLNVRMIRSPHGPTMTFKVKQFSIAKDIINFQKRPEDVRSGAQSAPLVILNNFGEEQENQLMGAMFQNMFPSLPVKTIKLSQCARVCLWNFDDTEEEIEMRHYRIKASPVGINRNIKRVVKGKKIPNLAKYKDISEYIDDKGYITSDSEREDNDDNRMILPQNYSGRHNKASHKSAIRLKEMGPRMTLQLIKIQEGVDDGQVLYNRFHSKTEKEANEQQKQKEGQRQLKRKRIETQEANVERKKQAKKMKKVKRKERWQARQKQLLEQEEAGAEDSENEKEAEN